MTALALLLSVAVSAAPSPSVKKLAMPALSTVGLTPEFTRFASEHLAQELSTRGISVTTDREISSVIGLERQKQLLGCSNESTSCLAELAGALGVDALVLGDMGKFGDVYRVNLKIVSASTSEKLAATSFKASSENEVLDQLTESAQKFAAQLKAGAAAPNEAVSIEQPGTPAHHPLRSKAWIPAVAAVAFAGFGTYEALSAKAAHDELLSGGVQGATAGADRAKQGETSQLLAGISLGLAGASLAAAATMFLLTGDEESSAAVVVTPSGPALSFSARF